ncbi:hypothetical protein ACUNWD_20355 [Sunxiuqinia sp. A32]|uniref:hypothetical protein n=1 Tax=Sunxiuqinia sp. A32 TaxID=3461496 RepID=UPI004045A8AB
MIIENNKHGPSSSQLKLIHANRGAPLPVILARNKAPARTESGHIFNRGKPPEMGMVCLKRKDRDEGLNVRIVEGQNVGMTDLLSERNRLLTNAKAM